MLLPTSADYHFSMRLLHISSDIEPYEVMQHGAAHKQVAGHAPSRRPETCLKHTGHIPRSLSQPTGDSRNIQTSHTATDALTVDVSSLL